jgi:hypothetical protein
MHVASAICTIERKKGCSKYAHILAHNVEDKKTHHPARSTWKIDLILNDNTTLTPWNTFYKMSFITTLDTNFSYFKYKYYKCITQDYTYQQISYSDQY